jgi:protein involved in polysaccharide export with SLBB domain
MRFATLILLFCLSTIVVGQNLSPAVIQEISKLSKQDLQQKLKSQDTDSKKIDAQPTLTDKVAADLTLPTDNERIDLIQKIEQQKQQEQFFGESFFKFAQVVPKTSGPVPDSYLLGAGDELIITLFGEVQLSHELTLDRENNIFPPEIGRIALGGVRFDEAKELIKKRFSNAYSTLTGKKPKTKMFVTVGRHRKVHVSVMGHVKKPQNMILSSLNSVFDAVVLAGGPTKEAAIRRVEIKRGSEVIYYDLYTNILPSIQGKSLTLEDGDVIYVTAKKNTVNIVGGVRLEGTYEISKNSTVMEMVNIAGGLTQNASDKYIDISTIIEDKQVSLAFPTIQDRNKHVLRNGDILTINQKDIFQSSVVEIIGSVLYPGEYPFIKGKTISDYIQMAGGLKEHTYQKRFEILEKINPKEYTSKTVTNSELNQTVVKDGSIIQIFSDLEFIETRKLYVVSYQQGLFTFDYFKNADIYDYIAKIGGIKYTEDNSFLEVVRLSESSDTEYAKVYKVQIDSNYLDVRISRKNAFKVFPDDIIIIRKNPDYEDYQTVKISGQVYSAGSYPIVKKGERLSSILKRSNGLRQSAYIDGIKYLRRKSKDFMLINDTTEVQSSYLRIPIDFNSVLKNEQHEDNIVIIDGDSIFVPKNPYTVIVQGQVNTAKAVVFVEGRGVDYYIAQAGGLTAYADGDRVQVIKANGKHVENGLFSSDKINAGTIITVPKEKEEDASSSIINTIFQSVSAIVTTLVLIKQL